MVGGSWWSDFWEQWIGGLSSIDLRQDLTYAVRRLLKAPGFALAAIVSIALGIGANSTIFSMVSRFVLRPAPVGESGDAAGAAHYLAR